MKCINLSQFVSYQNGKLTPEEHNEVKEHIETCSICQKNAREYEHFLLIFRQSYQPSYSKDIEQCYADSDLLEFIEGKPSQKSKATFYNHLLECQSCMDRMLSLRQDFDELLQEGVLTTLETRWDKARRFINDIGTNLTEKLQLLWTIPKSLKPAYALAGLVLLLCISVVAIISINNSSKTEIIMRDNQFDIAQKEVQLIHPANDSQLNIHKSEFQWSAPEKAVNYNFFLLDDRGNILWETSTEDKRLELPDNITLNNDQLYFWRVEALFDDGTSRLSPMISFTNLRE
jgi:hypothetical protein